MVWTDSYTSRWEYGYEQARQWYAEHGNLNIPPQYKADGIWIAKWLNEQRQIYIGNRPGKQLTKEQIERLEAVGMTWENKTQVSSGHAWRKQFAEAKQYYQDHGN